MRCGSHVTGKKKQVNLTLIILWVFLCLMKIKNKEIRVIFYRFLNMLNYLTQIFCSLGSVDLWSTNFVQSKSVLGKA